MDQDEIACHALGERRMNYLNQIRCILDQMEDNACSSQCTNTSKPLLQFPGYVNRKNPEFNRPPYLPKCTQNESGRQEEPTPATKKVEVAMYVQVPLQSQPNHGRSSQQEPRPRCDSFELVGGDFFSGCDCTKHNGLQDQCRRRDCIENPDCLTEPQPSCTPSRMIPEHRDRPLYQKYDEEFKKRLSNHDQTYLC